MRKRCIHTMKQTTAFAFRRDNSTGAKERDGGKAEGFCDTLDGFKRRRGVAAFQTSHHLNRKIGFFRKGFLRQAQRFSVMANITAENLSKFQSLPSELKGQSSLQLCDLRHCYC